MYSTISLTAILMLLVASVASSPLLEAVKRPSYIDCVTSDECSFDSCCVLGMGRYSVPTCQRRLQLNENCRPASEMAFNSTVAYPDGSVVSLHDVHLIMCPCAAGLTCHQHAGKCLDFDHKDNINSIDDVFIQD